MEAETKFRVWSKKLNKMFVSKTINKKINSYNNDGDWILTQLIGITDKHGKELYQKDIIKYISENDGETEFISVVDASLIGGISFDNMALFSEFDMYGYGLTNGNFEIIGNIYKNSELLKKAQELSKIEKEKIILEYGWCRHYADLDASFINKDIFDFHRQLRKETSGTDYREYQHTVDEAYEIYLKCQKF